MREPRRWKLWLIVGTVVVLFHLFLLVYVKPSYFSFMLPSPRTLTERFPGAGSNPDAILYIPVELDEPPQEQPHTHLVEDTDEEEPVDPADQTRSPTAAPGSEGPSGLGDIVGDASRPLPQGPDRELVKIPPRPLQITWPDTRRLKHCLGHQIDVQVQVDQDGRILHVEPRTSTSPPECVQAALECARQIVFAPGQINGRPARMWTEIRVDFRKKNGS